MNLTKINLAHNPKVLGIWNWGIFGLLAILFFMIYGNLAQDDAYITFRYARNIALSKGFVYNDGEWVLGTTTPLYTIFLALVSYFSKVDVVKINTIISTVSLWISAGLLYELRKSLDSSGAFFLALIFITNPFLRNFIGMESYFLLCIFMLTIWTYHSGKRNVTSLLNGLLILIRYEMIFLSIIIGVWDYIKNRKLPYWILPGFILVFIWLVYATIVFRSPIPLSASAKLLAPRIPFLVGGAVYWYQILSQVPASFLIIVFSLMGIFGILFFNRLFQEYVVISLFSVVYIIVASIYAGSFPWYYAPLVPGFAVAVILGVNYFSHFPTIDKLKLSEEKKRVWNKGMQFVSVILLVTIQLVFWGKDYYLYQDKIGDNRYTPYKQVADWLNENATREQSIASFEIGYVGYFTDLKVIDLAGLVTPILFPWVDDGAEASLYHALYLLTPDFVLIPNDNIKQKEVMNDAVDYQIVEALFDGNLLFKRK
jgi:hypothetical protein